MPLVTRVLVVLALSLALANAAAETMNRPAPDISGGPWLNSSPLQLVDLRGRVVLVEFWTYACWNCRNVEPYIKRWHETYGADGLVVVAVHTPELEVERDIDNVRQYASRRSLSYPIVIDNDFSIWRRFANRYWPTVYLIDKQGMLRYRAIGEGRYDTTERWIKELLSEQAVTNH